MGRQSARLWYKNKDHKDIYFQGSYHDKMYLGSTLLWEKLYDKEQFGRVYDFISPTPTDKFLMGYSSDRKYLYYYSGAVQYTYGSRRYVMYTTIIRYDIEADEFEQNVYMNLPNPNYIGISTQSNLPVCFWITNDILGWYVRSDPDDSDSIYCHFYDLSSKSALAIQKINYTNISGDERVLHSITEWFDTSLPYTSYMLAYPSFGYENGIYGRAGSGMRNGIGLVSSIYMKIDFNDPMPLQKMLIYLPDEFSTKRVLIIPGMLNPTDVLVWDGTDLITVRFHILTGSSNVITRQDLDIGNGDVSSCSFSWVDNHELQVSSRYKQKYYMINTRVYPFVKTEIKTDRFYGDIKNRYPDRGYMTLAYQYIPNSSPSRTGFYSGLYNIRKRIFTKFYSGNTSTLYPGFRDILTDEIAWMSTGVMRYELPEENED